MFYLFDNLYLQVDLRAGEDVWDEEIPQRSGEKPVEQVSQRQWCELVLVLVSKPMTTGQFMTFTLQSFIPTYIFMLMSKVDLYFDINVKSQPVFWCWCQKLTCILITLWLMVTTSPHALLIASWILNQRDIFKCLQRKPIHEFLLKLTLGPFLTQNQIDSTKCDLLF